MRIGLVIAVSSLVVAVAVSPLAVGQGVVQLDESSFSAQELVRLSAELARLQDYLDNTTLGSQRALGQDAWTAESFAVFTAGSLAERGYSVRLAEAGPRVWVLAEIALGDRTVWVPIEPTPQAGAIQSTLGRIPFVQPGTSSLRLKADYLSPSSTFPLPQNRAPTATFRVSETSVSVGGTVRLIASLSSDPDGQIVTYRWCVGEAPCVVTTSWSYIVRLDEPGDTKITLVVVDNAGRSASANGIIGVSGEGIQPSQSPVKKTRDCDCGG